MLYEPDGTMHFNHLRRMQVLSPDISKPNDVRVNKFALHRDICDGIFDTITYEFFYHVPIASKAIACMIDVILEVNFDRKPAAFSTPLRATVLFHPMDYGADPEVPMAMSPEEGLRRIIENEVNRVWDLYDIDRFIDDVRTLADCLHVLTWWDCRSVHDVLQALQTLEPIAVRRGHDLDQFVTILKIRTLPFRQERFRDGYYRNEGWGRIGPLIPLPEGVWPDGLTAEDDVILVDLAGRTLVVDERLHLVVGATVAQRLEEQARRSKSTRECGCEIVAFPGKGDVRRGPVVDRI